MFFKIILELFKSNLIFKNKKKELSIVLNTNGLFYLQFYIRKNKQILRFWSINEIEYPSIIKTELSIIKKYDVYVFPLLAINLIIKFL